MAAPNTQKIGRLPRVSIGLAVYNGEQFLSQALDSLLSQSFSDFELIICDNASTDQTATICSSYACRYPRVRYHRNAANVGVARNFNLTFSLSTAPYFKWAGADDLCAPQFLERCVKVLDSRPDVVLCYPKTALIDERGVMTSLYDDQMDIQYDAPDKRFAFVLWNLRMCNAVFGLLRSDIMKHTRLFEPYPNSDRTFLAEMALFGSFVEIPENLFFRRAHDLSAIKYRQPQHRMALFNPARSGQLSFPNWRLFAGHLSAVRRAPLSWNERLRCAVRMRIWLQKFGATLFEDLTFAAQYFAAKIIAFLRGAIRMKNA